MAWSKFELDNTIETTHYRQTPLPAFPLLNDVLERPVIGNFRVFAAEMHRR